jgi:hypothetical protein
MPNTWDRGFVVEACGVLFCGYLEPKTGSFKNSL